MAQENAQITVSEIIGFLNEFDTPPFVFERMFQQSEMYYFYPDELTKLVTADSEKHTLFKKAVNSFIAKFDSAVAEYKSNKEIADTTTKEGQEPEQQPLKPNLKTVNEIKFEIQKELNRLGCNLGTPDGIIGPASKAALERFNKARKSSFSNDAFADPEFLKRIKLFSNPVCKNSPLSGVYIGELNCTNKQNYIAKLMLEPSQYDLVFRASLELEDGRNFSGFASTIDTGEKMRIELNERISQRFNGSAMVIKADNQIKLSGRSYGGGNCQFKFDKSR